jgi:hypothetical protein
MDFIALKVTAASVAMVLVLVQGLKGVELPAPVAADPHQPNPRVATVDRSHAAHSPVKGSRSSGRTVKIP